MEKTPEKMPAKIYATPRGSGTVSGVWTDMKMDDEPRGEYEYIRSESMEEAFFQLREIKKWANNHGHFIVEEMCNIALNKSNL